MAAESSLPLSTPSAGCLKLVIYPDELTVYRLPCGTKLPNEIFSLPWYTISKTLDELSVIIPSDQQFFKDFPEVKQESGWKCFKIDCVLDFGLVGILASIVEPLKKSSIPVFVVSTFDTDYILINLNHVENARKAICEATGYTIVESQLSLK